MIKINEKILSIPPYLSTGWGYIASIHMKETILVVKLTDGNQISVPSLNSDLIETIFNYHAMYLDKEQDNTLPSSDLGAQIREKIIDKLSSLESEPSVKFAIGAWDGMGGAMQHDEANSDAPDLPREMLEKLSDVAKIVVTNEEVVLPKAEANCNCFYCQIARAVNPNEIDATECISDEVLEEDLTFKDWKIVQTGENLYTVSSYLDENETYNVFLGDPIGCTCGTASCEHIVAVLKS